MSKLTIKNELLFAEVQRLLDGQHEVTIPTKGYSMLPFIIGERDNVTLTKTSDIKVGDIVLALIHRKDTADTYVLHRVWSVEGSHVTLMGDGNCKGQEHCSKEDIVGTAVSIEKKGRIIDCRSERHMRQAQLWRSLLPVRRIILAVYKRTLLKL